MHVVEVLNVDVDASKNTDPQDELVMYPRFVVNEI
jgi:hypothetical protein